MQPNNIPTQHLQEGYQRAYDNACKELINRNPLEIAQNSGADYDDATAEFRLNYLNENYRISYPTGEVSFCQLDGEVAVTIKVVLLHYLLKAGGLPLTGTLVSFREIPDGGFIYLEPFNNRVLRGLVANFGKKTQLLVSAAEKIGGRREKMGSAAVTLDVLPKVPMTYVIWEGDDEFPANGTVLFDASIRYYVPTEDIVVIAATGASLLNKTAKMLNATV
jgi:hypothetical protein